MTKWINTYSNLAAYSADTANFSFPHTAYAAQENTVKYDADPGALGYNIWGTVPNDTSSVSININATVYNTQVNNGYFMYNWTGGTITSLFYMFKKGVLKGQPVIDVSINLDTSNVTSMKKMFYECRQLKSITGIENFDTSNVTDMSEMFSACINLTSLDLSNFNTSKVETIAGMFSNCALTSLTISNFDTSNVTNMNGLFESCSSLITLDISNWDMSNVELGGYFFYGCYALRHIKANNTNQTTLEKIQGQLVTDGIASRVTITRDGYNWTYSGGQWNSTPI